MDHHEQHHAVSNAQPAAGDACFAGSVPLHQSGSTPVDFLRITS
jgi:hypothetical protein